MRRPIEETLPRDAAPTLYPIDLIKRLSSSAVLTGGRYLNALSFATATNGRNGGLRRGTKPRLVASNRRVCKARYLRFADIYAGCSIREYSSRSGREVAFRCYCKSYSGFRRKRTLLCKLANSMCSQPGQ